MKKDDQTVQTLELLEERAEVQKQRIHKGRVVLSKQTRVHTVTVPVSLSEEYLVIDYQPVDESSLALIDEQNLIQVIDAPVHNAQIQLNGERITLSPDAPIEILLSRETALVHKTTHAIERIDLHTHSTTQEHTITTELQKEVLEIQEGEDLLTKPNADH